MKEPPPFDPVVISLRPFWSGSELERRELASKILQASVKEGFFFIEDCGADVERILSRARSFFSESAVAKARLVSSLSERPGFVRGYIGVGGESGSPDLFERKEAFSYGWNGYNDGSASGAPSSPLEGPNVWPPSSPEFRADATAFYSSCVSAGRAVAALLALALGGVESVDAGVRSVRGESGGDERSSLMRLFHYLQEGDQDDRPSSSSRSGLAEIGSSPHTDWGCLTLIAQDGVGGLEAWIEERSAWVAVRPLPPERNALLVNCGDWLSLQSNGMLVSPLHRVRAARDRARQSCVFFYYPDSCCDGSIFRPRKETGDAQGGELRAARRTSMELLSLFKDQSADGEGVRSGERQGSEGSGRKERADPDLLSGGFAAYLARKWASVQRSKL